MQDYSFEPYWNFKTTKILKRGALIKMRPFKGSFADTEIAFKVLGFDGRYIKLVNLQSVEYYAGRPDGIDDYRNQDWTVDVGKLAGVTTVYASKYTYSSGEGTLFWSIDSNIQEICDGYIKESLLNAMKPIQNIQYGYCVTDSSNYDLKVNSQTGYAYYKKMGQADSFLRKLVPFDLQSFVEDFGSMTPVELHDWFCYDGYKGGSQSSHVLEHPIRSILFKDSYAVHRTPSIMTYPQTFAINGSMYFENAAFSRPSSGNYGLLWEVDLWNFKDWEFFEDWDN